MATPRKPVVFISHKHSDRKIATVLAKFIRAESNKIIRIFMSSDPRFKGVRLGEEISEELKTTLADCDVFLLVYTSPENDWGWCTWEWGVASHPLSKKTTMMVLQCGPEAPNVHAASRRVDCRDEDEVFAFVKQYLTDKDTFRSGKALAEYSDEEDLREKAKRLFNKLSPLIKNIDPPVENSTWPHLQISLPLETVQKIGSDTTPLDIEQQVSLVKESARVSTTDDKVLSIFGRFGMTPNIFLAKLTKTVTGMTGRKQTPLLDSCCLQIAEASADKRPGIRVVTVRDEEREVEYAPIVTRVQKIGYQKTVLFDLYFVTLPTHSSVSSKMLSRNQFYFKPLSKQFEQLRLLEIIERMKDQEKHRLPVLEAGIVRYVIHRAAIHEFIVENLSRAQDLTVHDLLTDNIRRTMFEQSFAFVGVHDSLEQARAKISGNIRDVFVTQTGSPNEPVRGWLTDVDLASTDKAGSDQEKGAGVSMSAPKAAEKVSTAQT